MAKLDMDEEYMNVSSRPCRYHKPCGMHVAHNQVYYIEAEGQPKITYVGNSIDWRSYDIRSI
jgi:hypothetical protein